MLNSVWICVSADSYSTQDGRTAGVCSRLHTSPYLLGFHKGAASLSSQEEECTAGPTEKTPGPPQSFYFLTYWAF